ncbi:MAG: trypsin-like peptidase domain-containing protein, partial [Armatimonadetes bacterium]|nr:trypsin-like peptidase domain-containing protein [Armatimonadota bacterium]
MMVRHVLATTLFLAALFGFFSAAGSWASPGDVEGLFQKFHARSQRREAKPGAVVPKIFQAPLQRLQGQTDSLRFAGDRISGALHSLGEDAPGGELTRGGEGSKVYKKAAPAVVLILTPETVGTGSVIDGEGRVLTNWHVVGGRSEALVVFKPEKDVEVRKDKAHRAIVEKVDKTADLAILKIVNPPKPLQTIQLGTMDSVEVAQDVHAIGHPKGEIWTYTKGTISQIRPSYEWRYSDGSYHKRKVIQTQTPISPGNSGGPLLDDEARLIGVNSFTKEGELLNYAVAVDVIRKFLTSPVASETPSTKPRPEPSTIKKKGGLKVLGKYDTDGNGVIDMVAVDLDGDGRPDG